VSTRLKTKRKLAGHFGKVVSMTWARDSERVMTASQDGNVIVWTAASAKKAALVPLKSSWVMFAELSQTADGLTENAFATGGLDNVATVWRAPSATEPYKLEHEFYGHDGYVCGAKFVAGGKLLTTSGDNTAGLWDVTRASGSTATAASKGAADKGEGDDRVATFRGHEKDVTSADLRPGTGGDEFVTSSTDGTCAVWSLNQPTPQAILRLHSQDLAARSRGDAPPGGTKQLMDINKVKYVPGADGRAVAFVTEAMGSFLYDVRTRACLNTFGGGGSGDGRGSAAGSRDTMSDAAKYSLAFSKSGRLVFVACEDYTIEVWDALLPNQTKPLQTLTNVHQNRVTDVAVPNNGLCLGAVSWDATGSITAP